jgi:pimeloyl-ACP methyl ester carboxylesterase
MNGTLWSWPGAGDQPSHPNGSGYCYLIELAAADAEHGSDIVAQSMGGAVAIGLALAHPEKVRRLVLVATSGGLNLEQHATEGLARRVPGGVRQRRLVGLRERPDFAANSHLRVLGGGIHWLAHDRPEDVAGVVIDHLGGPVRAQIV